MLERLARQVQPHQVEDGGSLPQYLHQLEPEQIAHVTEDQTHDQLAQDGRLTEAARAEAAEHGEEQDASDPENDRRDRVRMVGFERMAGHGGCGQRQ